MSEKTAVSFVICTYNRAHYVDKALRSLINQAVPKKHSCEILIVDNNSDDHTSGIAQKYKHSNEDTRKTIRYVKERQQGIAYARNRGIREAHGEYIIFLDDDIEATKAFFSNWISFFVNHPDARAAGGKIHVTFDDPAPSWISNYLLPLYGRHDLGDRQKKYPPRKFPFGGNMGVKKSVFKEIGIFNTAYGQRGDKLEVKGEEKELAERIRAVTDAVYYLPQAFVYHHVDKSRLTKAYLKKHATGIGRGLKKQIEGVAFLKKARILGREMLKTMGTPILSFGYILGLQLSKATMLVRFRRWIWEGFFK